MRERDPKRVLVGFERELVVALRRAPRAGYATLAAELTADERTVRRTMERLREDGILTFSSAMLYENSHGWLAAQVGIGCEPGRGDAVARALAERPDTRFVAATTGETDVVADLVAPDAAALYELVASELGALDGVRAIRTHVAMRLLFHTVDWDPQGRRSAARQRAVDGVRADVPARFDGSDLEIVRALGDDVRAPASRLARQLGLHETTVQRRLHRMVESGALQTRADVPPAALGFPVEARFTLSVQPSDLDAALRRLSAEPALRALYVVTGPASVLGFSVHESTAALERLLNGAFAQLPGVLGFDLALVLRAYKRTGARV